MEDWVFLIIFIILLILAIKYWYITLALGAIGLVIYLIIEVQKQEKLNQATEAARIEQQQGYRKDMILLGERSLGLFEELPKFLSCAEEWLGQAEVDFTDGAFAPFWDSIEKAVKTLGSFDEGINAINDNLSSYTKLITKYEDTPPEFRPSRQSVVSQLRVGTATAERVKAIVRSAQRDFQFATIYEQRRTNQILVAGFTNLAQALDRMTWQITTSIDDLSSSVDVMSSTLNESLRVIHSRMGDAAETTTQHHEKLMKEVSEGAARERKALEMLDDIQRRRRPSL